jgi:hypothetical protein
MKSWARHDQCRHCVALVPSKALAISGNPEPSVGLAAWLMEWLTVRLPDQIIAASPQLADRIRVAADDRAQVTVAREVVFAATAADGADRFGHPAAIQADVRLATNRDRRGLAARPAAATARPDAPSADLAQPPSAAVRVATGLTLPHALHAAASCQGPAGEQRGGLYGERSTRGPAGSDSAPPPLLANSIRTQTF